MGALSTRFLLFFGGKAHPGSATIRFSTANSERLSAHAPWSHRKHLDPPGLKHEGCLRSDAPCYLALAAVASGVSPAALLLASTTDLRPPEQAKAQNSHPSPGLVTPYQHPSNWLTTSLLLRHFLVTTSCQIPGRTLDSGYQRRAGG